MAITTSSSEAVAKTRVGLDLVAVIASLIAHLSRRQINSPNPIAALSNLTVRPTGIRLNVVPVVTSLTRLHQAIATTGRSTIVTTGIEVIFIPIIAGLNTGLNKPITTASQLTIR